MGLARVYAYSNKHNLNCFSIMQYTKWRALRHATAFGRRGYFTHYLCCMPIGAPMLQPPPNYLPMLATSDEAAIPAGQAWPKPSPYNVFGNKEQPRAGTHKQADKAKSRPAIQWTSSWGTSWSQGSNDTYWASAGEKGPSWEDYPQEESSWGEAKDSTHRKRKSKAAKDPAAVQQEPTKKKIRKTEAPTAASDAPQTLAVSAASPPPQSTGLGTIGHATTPPPGGWGPAIFVGNGLWKIRGVHMYPKPVLDGTKVKTVWTKLDADDR